MYYSQRDLPHWHPAGASIFLTWRLHGTLAHERPDLAHRDPGGTFLAYDRALDSAVSGPTWLRDPDIARCVVDALRFGQLHLALYELAAFCLMPNHVHVVMQPRAPVSRITESIKRHTALEANIIRGRVGEQFWQDESDNQWIRNESEWNRIIHYTELNPVAAGLVEAAEQWPWSSASSRPI